MPEVHRGTVFDSLHDKRLIVTYGDLRIGLLHGMIFFLVASIREQSVLNILLEWINNYEKNTNWKCFNISVKLVDFSAPEMGRFAM